MRKMKYVCSPVNEDWMIRGEVKAAHLYPLAPGQQFITYVFRSDAEHELNRAQNGLFLHSDVEEAFDQHLLTINPFEKNSKK